MRGDTITVVLQSVVYAQDMELFIPDANKIVKVTEIRKQHFRFGQQIFRADGTRCYPLHKKHWEKYGYRPSYICFNHSLLNNA